MRDEAELTNPGVPPFLYGTAWKEERTEALVREALAAGFRGIDTANQRRHYDEAAIGAAIAGVPRETLFLQTKFTYLESQDHRLPFDPAADYPTQVRQSFDSSLSHFGVETIDSVLLHGPRTRRDLSTADREVWRAMEELQRSGRVRFIGVSNVRAEQLAELCHIAEVRPRFVQNRCFAALGWDRAVREVCRREGVIYQGFSLLTANSADLSRGEIVRIAKKHGRSLAQVIFRFALHLGMICLTGTADPKHMREDLSVEDFELTREEIETIERISE
jgi:diketogulonate reductase-like aldo/keto reductase